MTVELNEATFYPQKHIQFFLNLYIKRRKISILLNAQLHAQRRKRGGLFLFFEKLCELRVDNTILTPFNTNFKRIIRITRIFFRETDFDIMFFIYEIANRKKEIREIRIIRLKFVLKVSFQLLIRINCKFFKK